MQYGHLADKAFVVVHRIPKRPDCRIYSASSQEMGAKHLGFSGWMYRLPYSECPCCIAAWGFKAAAGTLGLTQKHKRARMSRRPAPLHVVQDG